MAGWTISLILASGVCAVSGIAHLGFARRHHRVGIHFWFGLASLAVAVASLVMALLHPAGDEFGLLRVPYIGVMVFLAAVVVMTVVLGFEAVRRSDLAAEVKRGQHRWRALLDNLELAVLAYDTSGRVIYANPYLVRMSGRTEDEIVGTQVGENVAARDRDRFESALRSVLTGEAIPAIEVASVVASGEERLGVWSTVIFKDDLDVPVEFVAVGADLTDRRDAERSRDHFQRELDRMRSALAEEKMTLVEGSVDLTMFAGIVGESRPLKDVLTRVRQVASTESTVLLLGETGTGKELVAHAIHHAGSRANRPFVTVNCGGLPASLVESELFGHVRGAFTGAEAERRGRFGQAAGGTIFLDEVGELPLELQPKLLRVLQSGEFEKVGGDRTFTADVRVIAATHRDLELEVKAGRFREDLYYRLNVFPITLPPLRLRRDDIPLLIRHFVPNLAVRAGREIDEIPGVVIRRLQDYSWPGNVRELISVLERAVVTSQDRVLRLEDALDSGGAPFAPSTGGGSGDDRLVTLEENERRHILKALEATDGKISGAGGAAEVLGINPSTLRTRMKKLGLRR